MSEEDRRKGEWPGTRILDEVSHDLFSPCSIYTNIRLLRSF